MKGVSLRNLRRFRDTAAGYLFILPALLIIAVFGIAPIFFTLYVSLHKWRPGKKGGFLALGNYADLFGDPWILILVIIGILCIIIAGWIMRKRSALKNVIPTGGGLLVLAGALAIIAVFLPQLFSRSDKEMFDSLRVTVWYSIGTVPVQLVCGVTLAVLLNEKFRGKQVFRVIYLLPYIVPSVASAAVFERLLSLKPDSFANQVLLLFGGKPLQWLQESKGILSLIFGPAFPASSANPVASYWLSWAQGPSLALVSIMLYSWWVFIGYYALIYLNGLANIPRDLYEAAEVDGASRLKSFFTITVPLLSPTTYFLTILGIIGTFKAFNHIYILRHAAAGGTADPISVIIFFTFYRKGQLGYAAAMSTVLFVIVIGLTLLQRRVMERGVHYGG